MNRFDNIPTDALIAREAKARREAEELERAVKARLKSECKIVLGRVHRLKNLQSYFKGPHAYEGRKIIPLHIYVERWLKDEWRVLIGGPMENPRSTTGTGYNRKEQRRAPDKFEEIAGVEGDGPEWAVAYVERMKDF